MPIKKNFCGDVPWVPLSILIIPDPCGREPVHVLPFEPETKQPLEQRFRFEKLEGANIKNKYSYMGDCQTCYDPGDHPLRNFTI